MKPAGLVLIAAVALAGVGHFMNRPRDEPAIRRGASPPPVVIGGEDGATGGGAVEHDDTLMRRSPTAARRTAKRFLLAYLRWETGDHSARTAHALRASADARLARLLSSSRGQPEPIDGVSRAQLTSLIAGTVGTDRAATVAAKLTRDGQPSGLALIVERRQGRWQVTSVGR